MAPSASGAHHPSQSLQLSTDTRKPSLHSPSTKLAPDSPLDRKTQTSFSGMLLEKLGFTGMSSKTITYTFVSYRCAGCEVTETKSPLFVLSVPLLSLLPRLLLGPLLDSSCLVPRTPSSSYGTSLRSTASKPSLLIVRRSGLWISIQSKTSFSLAAEREK